MTITFGSCRALWRTPPRLNLEDDRLRNIGQAGSVSGSQTLPPMIADHYTRLRTRVTLGPMKHDPALLQAALIGYKSRLAEIDQAMADIRQRLAPTSGGLPDAEAPPKRRFPLATRRRMAAAQRRRRAAARQVQEPEAKKEPRLSPAARKRISEATRKRWAEFRAQKAAMAKKAAAKKAPPAPAPKKVARVTRPAPPTTAKAAARKPAATPKARLKKRAAKAPAKGAAAVPPPQAQQPAAPGNS